jgi:uncharacterized RDD family membrane protein YckC
VPGKVPTPEKAAPPPGWPFPPGVQVLGGAPVAIARPLPHGLPVAPLGLRFLARLIDFGILLVLSVAANAWFIYLFLSDLRPYFAAVWRTAQTGVVPESPPAIPGRVDYFVALIPLVIAALWLAYEVPAIARSGQTYGKRVVGIKVMALESAEPIGGARALRRWNTLGLPVLGWACCGIGFLFQLVDYLSPVLGGPLHLALHDRSAATVVVHSGRKGHEIVPVKSSEQTGEQS